MAISFKNIATGVAIGGIGLGAGRIAADVFAPEIEAGVKAAQKLASEKLATTLGEKISDTPRRLGIYNQALSMDHKVILEYKIGTASTLWIEALLPPNFNLELRSNWSQKTGMGLKDVIDKSSGATAKYFQTSAEKAAEGFGLNKAGAKAALEAGGKKAGRTAFAGAIIKGISEVTGLGNTTMKIMTAHYWDGSSPVSCNIPFEFIAEEDPEKEVIQPLRELYKLAAPYELHGVIIPPGPSIAGLMSGAGVVINIYVGSLLVFKNVVIDSVSAEIDTRMSKSSDKDRDKKMLHAKVDVSFTSFYTLTRDDVDVMFNDVKKS